MRWISIIGLLLIVPGCADPVLPDELKAVLDDPRFSEVGEVVHQGNLDGLPGCWGSYGTYDMETRAVFVEFGDADKWRYMTYWGYGRAKMVAVEEGTYTVEDEHTVRVVIDHTWSSDPYTGELVPDDLEGTITRDYEVSLQGDQMSFFSPGVEADQYDGTFLRFSECP